MESYCKGREIMNDSLLHLDAIAIAPDGEPGGFAPPRFHVVCGNCGREYACDEFVRDAAARSVCPDCGESYSAEIRATELDGISAHTLMRAENTNRTVDGISPSVATRELDRRELPTAAAVRASFRGDWT
jgi:hypothetical protein